MVWGGFSLAAVAGWGLLIRAMLRAPATSFGRRARQALLIAGALLILLMFRYGRSPDRWAADWVLARRGAIECDMAGRQGWASSGHLHGLGEGRLLVCVGGLPWGRFELLGFHVPADQLSDLGLANFKGCQNLRSLDLDSTAITDVGLANFRDCKNLQHLRLVNTRVTDSGLAHFQQCKDLASLELNNTPITDAGLAYLRDCRNLRTLSLFNTQVTDSSLPLLKKWRDLQWLNPSNTKMSAAGLADLQRALPRLQINR
jgi:hypothetical protein